MTADEKCDLADDCCDCEGQCKKVKITDLLPCPHCGSTKLKLIDCTMDDPCYQVGCPECIAYVGSEESFVSAAETWNQRAVPTEAPPASNNSAKAVIGNARTFQFLPPLALALWVRSFLTSQIAV